MKKPEYQDSSFYSLEEERRIADDIEVAITIPVNSKKSGNHQIYNFTEVKKLLRKAQRIAIQDCGCKTRHCNCDAPLDVCISLDEAAKEIIENGTHTSKLIGLDEAIDALERSHEAGLVHVSYIMKGEEKPALICSCCSCCCHTLGGMARNMPHSPVKASQYIASNDTESCIACGTCVERCMFATREIGSGALQFNSEKCFGCGLCVSTCPEDAISLVLREEKQS